jgi:predicted Zn-dependent protease
MYEHYLQEGFKYYPYSTYFFPRLIDYYTTNGKNDEAMEYIDEAMEKDSLNQLFLLAKHSVLMSQKRYCEALKYGVTLLRDNPDQAIPNYNVGYIYYERGKDAMNQKNKSYRQKLKDAQEEYKKCLPYIERYKMLMPQERNRWYPILYDVYYNLNMGSKFESLQ